MNSGCRKKSRWLYIQEFSSSLRVYHSGIVRGRSDIYYMAYISFYCLQTAATPINLE